MFQEVKTYEGDCAIININFIVCIVPCVELTANEKKEIVDKKIDGYFIKMSNGENIKIKKEQYTTLENCYGEWEQI